MRANFSIRTECRMYRLKNAVLYEPFYSETIIVSPKERFISVCVRSINPVSRQYIANQLKQDRESEQLSMFDPHEPFTGSK